MTDIEILESLKSYTCKPEVLDKAIKALEQELQTGHWITTRTLMHDGEY